MGAVIESKMKGKRIIGLTGGIATGKSTVSDYLASRYGLLVLDADVFAREAVAKGGKILGMLRDRYGLDILLADGNLNRPKLGEIIFHDEVEKRWVEQQVHPYVRKRFKEETSAASSAQLLVYSIPLLFEANLTHLVTEIWVVACSPVQQLARLMSRSKLSKREAQARIDAQLSLVEKCDRSDYVLDNFGSREALFLQVDRLLAAS